LLPWWEPRVNAAADSGLPAGPVRFAFGDFVFDRTRRLVHGADGAAIAMSPRALDALEIFVARPGELIDKDALMQALWPGRVVEENSLSQVVSALRRALGDDGERRRYLQTEARRGFRLVVPVLRLGDADADAALTATPLTASAPRSALAVLPFVSLGAGQHDDLLEVGMADSLIARLSTVRGLVLRSIGSTQRFADAGRDPAAAARALDVAWVLDGTLQRAGERLRVNARLLGMPSGVATWSASFTVDYTSVFELQDAISEQVARALAAPLGGQTRWLPALAATRLGGTRNLDAYQCYLAANRHAQVIRADALIQSLTLYRQALDLDPRYALAHVGIAEAHRRMIMGADGEPRVVLDALRQHVLLALELAPDLAEAHAQMGWIHFWFDYDWPRAEQAFRLALTLNPNVALAHLGLGHLLLSSLGRIDDGLQHLRRSRELDPLSLIAITLEAGFIADAGDVATGRARLQRVLQIEPRFWVAHMAVGALALKVGDDAAAVAALRIADGLAQSSQAPALLGVALARAGLADHARGVLERLQAQAAERYTPPTSLATVHAALGDAPAALDHLERAFEAHDPRLAFMRNDPRWRDLRSEPRFAALLAKMRLDHVPPGLCAP